MKTFKLFITLAFSIIFASQALAEVRIASWNIKRYNGQNKNIEAMVEVLSYFDLIAIQEVMNPDAMVPLVKALQDKTNVQWGVMNSHRIGRGTYKEAYSFIWRKSEVEYVDSAVVYIDNKDVFAREPLSARFVDLSNNKTFIAANIHVLYGDSKSDREPEIIALRKYWDWLGLTFPNEQYFLMGDFNMDPDDDSFNPLKQVARPLITRGATTLSETDGRYVNLYDNIWIPNNMSVNLESNILEFPDILQVTHSYARKYIADHAPVYMSISSFDDNSGFYNAVPFDENNSTLSDNNENRETLFVRANERSKIYHIPNCGSYDVMLNSNYLIEFKTEQEALDEGYRKAFNCAD